MASNVVFQNRIGQMSWLVVFLSFILCVVLPTSTGASTAGFDAPTAFVRQNSINPDSALDDNTTNNEGSVDADTNVEHTTDTASPNNVTTVNTTTTITIPEWKQALPFTLRNKTKTLQRIVVPGPGNRVVEVYLLGTAHVSTDCSRDVQLLLETVQPNVIFLELCDGRIPMLVTSPPPPASETEKDPPKRGFWRRRRGRPKKADASTADDNGAPPPPRSLYTTAASLLTNMQQDFASSLGVELGGEFRVAYDYWDQHRTEQRLHMILGDRPLYLTLTRAWESLRLWGKTKLLIGLLISSFQKPNPEELKAWMQSILSDDSGDLLSESIAELAKHFPTLEEVIIRERDAYMACKLYQACRELLRNSERTATGRNIQQTQRMVAIVGAGHVQGICKWLTTSSAETPEQILARLIQIKKPIPEEDSQYLVHDVLELNYDLLQEVIRQTQP